ncbi:PREDICTED: uncharacterized protein LOC109590104 [Amphimedon queenslandica]|uniref:Uncharacterized protein n=1 Tax=Amphimedon queenslandica TaxID=400682 RepID=A0AAN0JXD4_AMPQE|nr:PREDICTED: uncharacterized protein LOC109590104 [Amphimedon queenslandica]XP_019861605.1 PREDICTED: uncharacterized protein LOC109590104 [Amphimedon queenslandica]XP_019861606.1 PREDICTED: uncharacterized protein LOC109590104 [Amphimedon queenslandica]XP_019861607.1 PREDICTED: uncharacterized protein LOC109590104 [Amphimedon queenslandica]|eukprot:XP_019861604.1 PREDICTED: uncharacterized protein LOC109590104 [Amphimedon queenslandica]
MVSISQNETFVYTPSPQLAPTSHRIRVPIVFWGHHPPVHDITCMTRTEEDKGGATGTKTGQICIWNIYRKRINGEFVFCLRLLLLGMESGDRNRIVSLSKNGCIALWDGKDGMCLKTVNNLGNGMHYGIKLQVWSLSLVSFIERKVLISSLISLALSLTHGSPQPPLVPLLTQFIPVSVLVLLPILLFLYF